METADDSGRTRGPPDRLRISLRLGTEYFLRSMQLLVEFVGGDLLTALVFMAVVSANVAHLNADGPDGPLHADSDDPPPDALRKPVSVLALSGSLNLPYETTRRHAAKLLKAGQCERVAGGLIVPVRVLVSERHDQVLRANMTNLRRLFRALTKAGVDLA
ncbi:MAG TPA: hypothetical protein VHZ26_12525 [Caulobacteraceae bacterium]|nr:hypothetical protein [Caulobacteraceae bacterium]